MIGQVVVVVVFGLNGFFVGFDEKGIVHITFKV